MERLKTMRARLHEMYKSQHKKHDMQIHDCREDMLQNIVCEDGWKMAEVGVFLGDFSAYLLSLGPAELHLIDPFEGQLCSGYRDVNQARTCE